MPLDITIPADVIFILSRKIFFTALFVQRTRTSKSRQLQQPLLRGSMLSRMFLLLSMVPNDLWFPACSAYMLYDL